MSDLKHLTSEQLLKVIGDCHKATHALRLKIQGIHVKRQWAERYLASRPEAERQAAHAAIAAKQAADAVTFEIDYTDPETEELVTIVRTFMPSGRLSPAEQADDLAYMLADKGNYTIKVKPSPQ